MQASDVDQAADEASKGLPLLVARTDSGVAEGLETPPSTQDGLGRTSGFAQGLQTPPITPDGLQRPSGVAHLEPWRSQRTPAQRSLRGGAPLAPQLPASVRVTPIYAHVVQADDWHKLPRSIPASDVSAVQNWADPSSTATSDISTDVSAEGKEQKLLLARASSLSNSRWARTQRKSGPYGCVCICLFGSDHSAAHSEHASASPCYVL